MTRGFSLWLDTLRACAALIVLFGHMAHLRFTGGDYYFLREINIASDAVVVFFVISGIVIAYAGERDGSFGTFAFNRLSRLLTVVVPALLLTLAFDAWGTRIDMAAYPLGYYQDLPIWEFLVRGLSFSNEFQGMSDRVRLGSNGPLWSLSYEFAYYAFFAVAVFLKGPLRVVLLAWLAVIVGLPILALLPAWYLGVLVWRRIASASAEVAPMPLARALLLAMGAPAFLIWCRIAGIPPLLEDLTALALAPINHDILLGYSDELLWNSLIAIGVSLHLLGVHALSQSLPQLTPDWAARAIRWVAGASFSLYVTHYPTLQLMDALLPDTSGRSQLIQLVAVLTVALLFAQLFERPLKTWRKLIAKALPRWRVAPPRGGSAAARVTPPLASRS